MIIINDLNSISNFPPSVVALGNFDGVHIGHQKLITQSVKLAKANGFVSLVFTFNELPINVIKGFNVINNIQRTEDKVKSIEELGADYLVCVDFDEKMQKTEAESFASDILCKLLNCKIAVCGFNYNFGYMGAGNAELLKLFGNKYNFDVHILDEIIIDNVTVSSTLIRSCLENGKVDEFEKYTGRFYELSGKVIEGQHLGTRMGFPTINLNLDETMALPKNGVYYTKVYIKKNDNNKEYDVYKGITNVGNKPTVGNFNKNSETYIFDFSGDLYGKSVKIDFIDFIREERKFDNIEMLERQIADDIKQAKNS